jgi:hypothetical protein
VIDLTALAAAVHLLGSSWQPWMVVLPGILIGLIVHAVPGLTTSMALAICLPLIPYMDFLQALIFMTAMYAGALFGVAIPAILLNVPGSAAAVGTTFDGFPMAQAGRHNEALGLALAASCAGLHRLFGADHAGGAVDVAIRSGLVVHHADADDRTGLGAGAHCGDGGGCGTGGGAEKRAARQVHRWFPPCCAGG